MNIQSVLKSGYHTQLIFTVALTLCLGTISKITQAATNEANAHEIEAIAEDAYLWGIQQAIFYGQRYLFSQDQTAEVFTGVNRFTWFREPAGPELPIIRPNATVLYGTTFLDLQNGPLVVEMPEIRDRYFALQIMDQYGRHFLMVGNQFNGTDARNYLLVPPGYEGKLPDEFVANDVIPTPSKTLWGIIRIAIIERTDSEIKKINAYFDQITVTPMSKWLANGKQGIPQAEAPVVPGDYEVFPRFSEDQFVQRQVRMQTAEDYFTILHLVLNDPSMSLLADSKLESEMLARMKTVGLGPGLDFEWSKLSSEIQAALTVGYKRGFEKVQETARSSLVDMNGWMILSNRGNFETNWLDRAVMAAEGWGGPDRNVSHGGAFLFVDADGQQLNGQHKYTLTIDLDNQPPVSEWWSLPIYNSDGFFVANEINRFTINSLMVKQGLFHIQDNKLVIYIQKDRPTDANQLKNWLPAPPDDFNFTARFYGPFMPLVNGSFEMPRPVKVPAR